MKGKAGYKLRTIICENCGKESTDRRPAKVKYCSLECYRASKRPQRKTGENKPCDQCGKEVYKKAGDLGKNKNNFCSLICANIFQGRNKLSYACKICDIKFKWSPSRITQTNPKYCSITCRNKDKEHLAATSLKGNLANINKVCPNKLEIKGSDILTEIGIPFETQVPMFGKFTVDVLIDSLKLIIQWDGVYWHSRDKHVKRDKAQDAYFKKCGYKVLRVTDLQIKNNLKEVHDTIRTAIKELTH